MELDFENLGEVMETLPDKQRIIWIKALVRDIKEEGTIQKIREIVNDSLLDD